MTHLRRLVFTRDTELYALIHIPALKSNVATNQNPCQPIFYLATCPISLKSRPIPFGFDTVSPPFFIDYFHHFPSLLVDCSHVGILLSESRAT